MAKITEYTSLNEGVEITYHLDTKKIQLHIAGNLSADGVDGTEITRHAQRAWQNVSGRSAYLYPFEVALGGYIWLINGWDWYDDATRKLVRDIGWAVINLTTGKASQIWAGTHYAYYQQYDGGPKVAFTYPGPVNEAIQVYYDADADGTPDYDRTDFLKVFVREWGYLFSQSSMDAEGILELSNTRHIFSLSNRVDDNIVADYADIATEAPYTSMTLTYYATDQDYDTGDGEGDSPYRIVVDIPASATLRQTYEFVAYRLMQDSDIDDGAGTVNGATADELLYYDGQTLVTNSGVWIDSVREDEKNFVRFTDYLGDTHTYPYIAAIVLKFGDNAVADANYAYWVYFDDPDGTPANGDEFGTSGAILVKDASDTDITGTVGGSSEIAVSFDYDGNVQGGRTAGTDADAWLVGVGITGGYAKKAFTIQRSTSNQVSIDPALNRVET